MQYHIEKHLNLQNKIMKKKKPIKVDDSLVQQYKRIQRKIIDKVLIKILKRKPTDEDFKKVNLGVIKNQENQMLLMYDKILLGRLTTIINQDGNQKFTINFTPNQQPSKN